MMKAPPSQRSALTSGRWHCRLGPRARRLGGIDCWRDLRRYGPPDTPWATPEARSPQLDPDRRMPYGGGHGYQGS